MKYLWIIVIAVLVLGGGYFLFLNNSASVEESSNVKAMKNGLIIYDTKTGGGDGVKTGDTVLVNYLGTLSDGSKFDSSYDRGEPFSFKVGAGMVIQGWEEGLLGMKVGGKRKLTLPPSLAYGERGVPGLIPPNSTLVFEIELLKIN